MSLSLLWSFATSLFTLPNAKAHIWKTAGKLILVPLQATFLLMRIFQTKENKLKQGDNVFVLFDFLQISPVKKQTFVLQSRLIFACLLETAESLWAQKIRPDFVASANRKDARVCIVVSIQRNHRRIAEKSKTISPSLIWETFPHIDGFPISVHFPASFEFWLKSTGFSKKSLSNMCRSFPQVFLQYTLRTQLASIKN